MATIQKQHKDLEDASSRLQKPPLAILYPFPHSPKPGSRESGRRRAFFLPLLSVCEALVPPCVLLSPIHGIRGHWGGTPSPGNSKLAGRQHGRSWMKDVPWVCWDSQGCAPAGVGQGPGSGHPGRQEQSAKLPHEEKDGHELLLPGTERRKYLDKSA